MSLTLNIPTVETERLILRNYRESDLDAVAAFNQTERSHWIGGPKNRHECWRVIIGIIGHWALRGYGLWMIEEKATGKQAGAVGIIHHEGWDEPELGWSFLESAGGKGYATEAAIAVLAYERERLGKTGVVSYIKTDNAPSIRVAERMGAFDDKDTKAPWPDHLVYRHPEAQA